MRADWFIAVVSLAAYAGADDNPPSHFQAYRLRCAGSNLLARNPSASFSIDNRTPRFTWAAAHAERGERQTAYRIVIKHHRRGANFDSLDVAFDSGRVLSADPSHQCDGAAGGCTLQSDAFYVWSVTLWDSAARSSLAVVMIRGPGLAHGLQGLCVPLGLLGLCGAPPCCAVLLWALRSTG